ncbi:MAG: hypothetical protein WBD22_08085 [Pyrinomonadaceae bacterium]
MFRKQYSILLFVLSMFIFGGTAVSAQYAPISGTVELQKADGTKTPVEGALVEVYRTDIKSTLPSDKTNNKGQFSFAGLPLGPTFVLSISAAGASPTYFPNVKAGNDKIVILLSDGDGTRPTEDQVRAALASAGSQTPQSNEEAKKAQAEYEKKKAEIEARNKATESKNVLIQKALDEGNAAYKSANYDVAVTKYNEGISLDPMYVGSAPILYNNRGAALRTRAVATFNQAVKATDSTAKVEGIGKTRKDLSDALDGYNKSFNILKSAPTTEIADPAVHASTKLDALRGAKDTMRLMAQTEQVDASQTETAKVLISEYVAVETDAVKKAEAKLTLADIYRVAGDSDNAIAAYKEILLTSPDNVDALAGAGLSLVNLGYINSDKAAMQEGANYLQKFADTAPSTHKYKDDAVGLIQTLKNEQKIAPQKVAKGKRN